MRVLRMADTDLRNRRVLIREDLNVPVHEGVVTSDARIRAALATLRYALEQRARVFVISHLGRPQEGREDPALSLAPVAVRLSELLGKPVPLRRQWLEGVDCAAGSAVLCENVRFNKGEKQDDEQLSRRMAALCEVFVMDAFGTAHRAEASTHGVARYAPVACAGPLLVGELQALERALQEPARPLVAIVGGSKVSTKLLVLESLLEKVDQLIVGGGIANTFLAATGVAVGKSLYEAEMLDVARRLLETARAHDTRSEEHTSELQSPFNLVCRLLLEKNTHFPSARVGVDPIQQVHLMENHDQSYHLWRDAGFRNRIVLHIDAHHDMWWIDDKRSLTIA